MGICQNSKGVTFTSYGYRENQGGPEKNKYQQITQSRWNASLISKGNSRKDVLHTSNNFSKLYNQQCSSIGLEKGELKPSSRKEAKNLPTTTGQFLVTLVLCKCMSLS